MDGWMDGWMDKWMDSKRDKEMDRQTDRQTDRPIDSSAPGRPGGDDYEGAEGRPVHGPVVGQQPQRLRNTSALSLSPPLFL